MRCRLLAIDIDGTLMRTDGTVDTSDRAAISRARELGIRVTLATGRLPGRTLPLARELGLDAPLICADGAITLEPTGQVRRLIPLSVGARKRLLTLAERTGLPWLFLTADHALGLRAHADAARGLGDW